MGKLLILCGAILCFSGAASAQDSVAALDASSPASEPAAVPVHFSPSDREKWQVAAGFQYEHFSVFGLGFHNLGYNASITRYLNDWFGLEGAVVMGFGHTGTSPAIPVALDAKSFFVGGGPHVAVTNKSRLEPWAHALVGLQHFRFTQTNNSLGLGSNSNLGFEAGGGVDYKLGGRAYWRVQADYVGTHFQSALQTNYSFGTGIVFNF
jgi:hypothetical protein